MMLEFCLWRKRIKDLNVNGNLIKFKMHFKLWLNNNNNKLVFYDVLKYSAPVLFNELNLVDFFQLRKLRDFFKLLKFVYKNIMFLNLKSYT